MDADIFDAENFWHRSMLDARLNLIEASKNLDAEMRNGIHRIHRHRKGRDARIFQNPDTAPKIDQTRVLKGLSLI